MAVYFIIACPFIHYTCTMSPQYGITHKIFIFTVSTLSNKWMSIKYVNFVKQDENRKYTRLLQLDNKDELSNCFGISTTHLNNFLHYFSHKYIGQLTKDFIV